jgi:Tol biopolymer transport system component
VEDNFFNKFPTYTPDGKNIVFSSNWCVNRREHNTEDSFENKGDFFENKGIYTIDISSRRVRQIVSDKYFGNRSLVVSPAGNSVAYIAWRKNTRRGLFLAYLSVFPSVAELEYIINTNLY